MSLQSIRGIIKKFLFNRRNARKRQVGFASQHVDLLEKRELLTTVTLTYNSLPFNTSIGSAHTESGFVTVAQNGGLRTGLSSWAGTQGTTIFNDLFNSSPTGIVRIERSDGGTFLLSSIQLNNLTLRSASALVPITAQTTAGTSSFSRMTDPNPNSFQTFSAPALPAPLTNFRLLQNENAGDWHQFDNVVLTYGPTVASISPVAPDLRYTPVTSLTVTLNEAADLSTFTFADLTLTRNGSAVTLDSSVVVSSAGGTSYLVSGLGDFTTAPGNYSLSVNARNIKSAANGTDGMGGAARQWIILPNSAPTDISLSSSTANENQSSGLTLGSFSTSDPDAGNTFSYSLVSGPGNTDNGSFTIDGNTLRTAAVFDYETKSSYTIRVRSTDQGGLSVEKAFTILVQDLNEAPTDMSLSSSTVSENQSVGSTVGSFSTSDPDVGNTFSYSFVSGAGDSDNTSFAIDGNVLKTAAVLDHETKSSYSIRVRSTDLGGLSTEKVFTINVANVTELGSIDVQLGQTQRSYVRYLDAVFDRSDDLMSMIGSGRFQMTKRDLNGINPVSVPLTPSMFSVVGNSARIDFGSNGLGGNRNTNAGDGYYELGVDMDGNGSYESKKYFYRLLGDVNGDRKVDSVDSSLVTSSFGLTNPNRDVNGDGVVNSNDRTLILRSIGRKLKDDLFADD